MPLRILPIFLLLLALLPSACGKIELPDEENSDTGNNQEEVPTEQTGDTLLPSQVLKCQTDTFICVSGYIVGYIRGTSLTHAIFGIPTDAPNSNMLLADRPSETSITNCLVVELSKNNDEVPREIINLYDHPGNYKKRIILIGYVNDLKIYIHTNGLTVSPLIMKVTMILHPLPINQLQGLMTIHNSFQMADKCHNQKKS